MYRLLAAGLAGASCSYYYNMRKETKETNPDKLGEITAGRVLLETGRIATSVRPDTYMGESIKPDAHGNQPSTGIRERYMEDSNGPHYTAFPEKERKRSIGMTIDELEAEHTDQAERLGRVYYEMTGIQPESYKKTYSKDKALSTQSDLAPVAPKDKHFESSLIRCKGCVLNSKVKVLSSFYGLIHEPIGRVVSSASLRKKSPLIASCIMSSQSGKNKFKFVRFISLREDNNVVLLSDENNKLFILKHVYYEIYPFIQNYPKTITALQRVRQSAFQEKHLQDIGDGLGVIPVVSTAKFGYVEVKGFPYDEVAFFKLTPYVDAQPVADIKEQLSSDQWNNLTTRMARYLGRLHTRGQDIKIIPKQRYSTDISVARVHNHPHMKNWLVNPDNLDKLYLIDWELSTDYGVVGLSPITMHEDFSYIMEAIPEDQKDIFVQCYLDE